MPHSDELIAVRGTRIRMLRGGEGPPLIFLHGASGHAGWLPFLDRLSQNFDVIAPEHPGFGSSDDPPWLDRIGDLALHEGTDRVPNAEHEEVDRQDSAAHLVGRRLLRRAGERRERRWQLGVRLRTLGGAGPGTCRFGVRHADGARVPDGVSRTGDRAARTRSSRTVRRAVGP